MATEVGAGSKHTPADREYLDSLFSPPPTSLSTLRSFWTTNGLIWGSSVSFFSSQLKIPPPTRQSVSDSGRVKIEATPFLAPVPGPPILVKAESRVASVLRASADVRMRALHEGGREVFELLSDSEPEADDGDSDLEVIEALQRTFRSSSAIPLPDPEQFLGHNSDSAEPDARSVSSNEEDDSDLIESDTVWLDDDTSLARIGHFRPTRKLAVGRMEYRQGPAAIYPIFRTSTGIVVDLSDQIYLFRDPTTKELYTLDTIIMNADNDSWDWSGGGSRQTALVTFASGEKPVDCRRIRYSLTKRFELRSALSWIRHRAMQSYPLSKRRAAEKETLLKSEPFFGSFMKIVRNAKCDAIDSTGNKCRGGPIMKPKPQASRGHQYFVGCSGWTTKFRPGHRTHSIPDNVDENLVANALAGLPLTDDPSKDTPPCSGIIHPHTGGKKKYCSYAHIGNGMPVQGKIHNYPCRATRSIYVPKDLSIRKVLIVHNVTGHNHPMPALTKLSFGLKDTYRGCIKSYAVLGATVAKMDNAQSTKMLLDGKTPSAYAPPLHNKRVKRDMLHAEKLEEYPNGLGVNAIYLMYKAETLTKSLPERYIHSYIESNKGEIIILTFVPYLLKLLDDPGVTSFDGDTTYKGIEGKLNEWELTIFAKVVQRDCNIFDNCKREATGKPLPFKRFVPDGNLLVTNVDMDAAQVIGLCRSALKFSDPEYSGIPKDTPPEQLPSEFIKVCWRHGKGPVHDFRSLVSPPDFAHLENFVYIDSKESLDAFSSFVYGLGIKKITDATPSTTNTNEAQHHWTNNLTGIKLTPVEALESLTAPSRRKLQIEAEAEKRRASNLATKSLKAQLKAAKEVSGKRRKSAAQTPVDAMQSDDTSAPVSTTSVAPSLPEFRSAELATGSAFSSLVTATPSLLEFSSVGLAMDSTFAFLGDFNWNLDVPTYSSNFDTPDIGVLFGQDVPIPNGGGSTFDPTFFSLATHSCNAVIPSNFDTPAVDPLNDFRALPLTSAPRSIPALLP
ncbi:hypothetical protein DFH09DRAFT_1269599 [Mycena vulgaris]|nr:hypothetical protein DFH09DRAFT_1269599 [Mycena vulgaris]